jgi:hypothetical protein
MIVCRAANAESRARDKFISTLSNLSAREKNILHNWFRKKHLSQCRKIMDKNL